MAALTAGFLLGGQRGIFVAVFILGLVVLAVAGWFFYRHLKRANGNRGFLAWLGFTAGTAGGELTAGDAKKLESLIQRFQEGVSYLGGSKYDFMGKPWYLLIGEPRSGKTCAVVQSGIMSEKEKTRAIDKKLAGVGATVNMNWWFTEKAVVLDTAGEMVFPSAQQEASERWKQFLRMLKRARPRCPINGILVTLAADELVAGVDLAERSRRMAEQLQVISEALGVRFPVYFLVTKCDLLPGFREFCDRMGGQVTDSKCLGWSHKGTERSPDAETVNDGLVNLAREVMRRGIPLMRMGDTGDQEILLLTTQIAARAGSEDQSRCLASALIGYVKALQENTDAKLSPFIRGVYLTSSGRPEAEASIVIGLEQLRKAGKKVATDGSSIKPELGGASCFLKAVFNTKVLPEKGLVTADASPASTLRKRQWWLWGATATASILLAWLALVSESSYSGSIGAEKDAWKSASHVERFRVVEIGDKNVSVRTKLGDETGAEGGLSKWYNDLRSYAERNPGPSGILAPVTLLSRLFGVQAVDRRPAFRAVVQQGVLQPTVDSAKWLLNRPEVFSNDTQTYGRLLAAMLSLKAYQQLSGEDQSKQVGRCLNDVIGPTLRVIAGRVPGGPKVEWAEDLLKSQWVYDPKVGVALITNSIRTQISSELGKSMVDSYIRMASNSMANTRLQFQALKGLNGSFGNLAALEINTFSSSEQALGVGLRQVIQSVDTLRRSEGLKILENPAGDDATNVMASRFQSLISTTGSLNSGLETNVTSRIFWQEGISDDWNYLAEGFKKVRSNSPLEELRKYLEQNRRSIQTWDSRYLTAGEDQKWHVVRRADIYSGVLAKIADLDKAGISLGGQWKEYLDKKAEVLTSISSELNNLKDLAPAWERRVKGLGIEFDDNYGQKYENEIVAISAKYNSFIDFEQLTNFVLHLGWLRLDAAGKGLPEGAKQSLRQTIQNWENGKLSTLKSGYSQSLLGNLNERVNQFPFYAQGNDAKDVESIVEDRKILTELERQHNQHCKDVFGSFENLHSDLGKKWNHAKQMWDFLLTEEGKVRSYKLMWTKPAATHNGFNLMPYWRIGTDASVPFSDVSNLSGSSPASQFALDAEFILTGTKVSNGGSKLLHQPGKWAVLAMLRDATTLGLDSANDRKSWVIPFRVGNGNGVFAIRAEFERKLPDTWNKK